MAIVLGRITVNNVDIMEVDSSPALGVGLTGEDVGDQAIDMTSGIQYSKFGAGATDWAPALSTRLETTATTLNGTKSLTATSSFQQITTGTATGYSVQLPNATTLVAGSVFDIWNLSSQQVLVKNNAGTTLTTLNANSRTIALCYNTSTAAGQWSLTYTLDNGNVFGTQAYYAEAIPETSTTSTTVWSNKVTLTTPTLPVGDYIIFWQFLWRSSAANRSLDVRIQRAASDVIAWKPFTPNVADRPLISGFRRVTAISGVQTFTLDFKVGGSGTTVYMSQSNLLAWRIA